MKKFLKELRETFLAGLIFLMPIIIIAVLLGKVYILIKANSVKLAAVLGVKEYFGISGAGIIGIIAIALSCVFFGLLMRLSLVKKLNQYFEKKLGSIIPGYGLYSKIAHEKLDATNNIKLYESAAWAHFGDSWQPGYLVTRISETRWIIYIPDAGPGNKHTGALHLMDSSKVFLCPDISMKALARSIEQLGNEMPNIPLPPQ